MKGSSKGRIKCFVRSRLSASTKERESREGGKIIIIIVEERYVCFPSLQRGFSTSPFFAFFLVFLHLSKVNFCMICYLALLFFAPLAWYLSATSTKDLLALFIFSNVCCMWVPFQVACCPFFILGFMVCVWVWDYVLRIALFDWKWVAFVCCVFNAC